MMRTPTTKAYEKGKTFNHRRGKKMKSIELSTEFRGITDNNIDEKN